MGGYATKTPKNRVQCMCALCDEADATNGAAAPGPGKVTHNCYTKEVWSAEKQDWCCANKQLGCPPKTETRRQRTRRLRTRRHLRTRRLRTRRLRTRRLRTRRRRTRRLRTRRLRTRRLRTRLLRTTRLRTTRLRSRLLRSRRLRPRRLRTRRPRVMLLATTQKQARAAAWGTMRTGRLYRPVSAGGRRSSRRPGTAAYRSHPRRSASWCLPRSVRGSHRRLNSSSVANVTEHRSSSRRRRRLDRLFCDKRRQY